MFDERLNEELQIMRSRVERAVEEEEQQYPTPDPEKGIDSRFVLDCVRAGELGDGILFAEIHRDRFVFNHNAEEWYIFDDHVWRRDEMQFVLADVEDVVDRYREEVERLTREIAETAGRSRERQAALHNQQKILLKRISQLRTCKGRNTCVRMAVANRNPIAIRGHELDRNPWALACANGVIDLRTGELRDGRPGEYLSRRSPVRWEGIDKPAENWEKFLMEIYEGDRELVGYLQRLFGYGITGLDKEHVFPVLTGRGRNGKGTLIETLSYVLGDHAGPIPAEMLLEGNRNADASKPTPELMALKGLRLAFASETDEGRRFSAAKVKWLTGGDSLTGRGLNEKRFITFRPTHLLVLLTNHKPKAPAHDFAFWERAFLVTHNVSYVDREPEKPFERRADKDLPEKLRAEASGILAWLVRGCLLWNTNGLAPPEKVREATKEYQEDEDLVGLFIGECCELGPHAWVEASDLYALFYKWYRRNQGRNVPSQKWFGNQITLTERYAKKKTSGRIRYRGLDIRDAYRDLLEAED